METKNLLIAFLILLSPIAAFGGEQGVYTGGNSSSGGGGGGGTPTPLTGDVTTTSGSAVTTVAKIQGTTVSGTTGTGDVVFSASPTLTGIPRVPTANAQAISSQIANATFAYGIGYSFNNINIYSTNTSITNADIGGIDVLAAPNTTLTLPLISGLPNSITSTMNFISPASGDISAGGLDMILLGGNLVTDVILNGGDTLQLTDVNIPGFGNYWVVSGGAIGIENSTVWNNSVMTGSLRVGPVTVSLVANGVLGVGTNAVSTTDIAQFLTPSLGSGNTVSLEVGTAVGARTDTAIGFTNNSTLNLTTASIGVHGRPAAVIDTSGLVSATGAVSTGTTFTITGCSASGVTGGASAGTFIAGVTGACTVTVTINGAIGLNKPPTNGWACAVSNSTTIANVMQENAWTTTTVGFSGTTISGDVIVFGPCTGF